MQNVRSTRAELLSHVISCQRLVQHVTRVVGTRNLSKGHSALFCGTLDRQGLGHIETYFPNASLRLAIEIAVEESPDTRHAQ